MKNLYKISKNIYFLKIEDPYELCMTFLRCQEYYESPMEEFRGKNFSILEFMEAYSDKFGDGCFTYPIDWAGFNLPSDQLKNCLFGNVPDMNKYDRLMLTVLYKITENLGQYSGEKFCLMGSCDFDDTFNHECAHALYDTNSDYKKYMTEALNNLNSKLKDYMYCRLVDIGYTSDVFEDEIQAFLATGADTFWTNLPFYKRYIAKLWIKEQSKPFVKLFNKYKLDSLSNFEEIKI